MRGGRAGFAEALYPKIARLPGVRFVSPVLELDGPLYCRGEGLGLVIGLRVAQKHCNARGTIHGGILATLADVALGYALAFSSNPPASLVTANLSLDFAGTARTRRLPANTIGLSISPAL